MFGKHITTADRNQSTGGAASQAPLDYRSMREAFGPGFQVSGDPAPMMHLLRRSR